MNLNFMRSKRYNELLKKIDKTKIYDIDSALKILKDLANSKFDETVELHIRLGIDTKKTDQQVKGVIELPYGLGKKIKICVFTKNPEKAKNLGAEIAGGEELIDKILKTKKIDFDVVIAEPSMMKSLAKIARILGPKGLMPSPKTNTVSDNLEEVIEKFKKGQVNFKNDKTGNLHIPVGKISFDTKKLKENIISAIETIKSLKPKTAKGIFIKNISLCTTMSPGIKVRI